MKVPLVDDLELIRCSQCDGVGKGLTKSAPQAPCPYCHGTGDRVIHRVQFLEIRFRTRKEPKPYGVRKSNQ